MRGITREENAVLLVMLRQQQPLYPLRPNAPSQNLYWCSEELPEQRGHILVLVDDRMEAEWLVRSLDNHEGPMIVDAMVMPRPVARGPCHRALAGNSACRISNRWRLRPPY